MPTEKENICCQSIAKVKSRITGKLECITQTRGFDGNCLNLDVLEVSYFEFVDRNGPFGDEEESHE